MTHRTIVVSSFAALLEFEYPAANSDVLNEARAGEIAERLQRLAQFPHAVMLEVAFSELDFANRWCWRNFGPAEGDCLQLQSEYPACEIKSAHGHRGVWLSHWYVKTDYNFGYNEWCFADQSSHQQFLENIPSFDWGEHYLK